MVFRVNEYKNDSIVIEIIDLYYKEIFNYCYSRLGYKKEDAEECTQETFIIFLSKWTSLHNKDNIRAWLYRTSDNVMKNHRRKANRYESELNLAEVIENTKDFKDDDSGVFEILSALTIDEEKLMIEYYLDRATAKELAKKYKVSEGAISMKIHRTRAKLKKIYIKENNM